MNSSFIPDTTIEKTITSFSNERNSIIRKVLFTWRNTAQSAVMEIQGDKHWLIVETDYTDEFDNWLDENLEDYDSLESMFEEEMKVEED